MIGRSISIRRHLVGLNSLILLLITILAGCGGGTSSTEDFNSTRIVGNVKNISGNALSGVQVVVAESGDSGITDVAGNFQIETRISGATANLVLTGMNFDTSVEVSGFPAEDSIVRVVLEVNETENSVTVSSITVSVSDDTSDGVTDPSDGDPDDDAPAQEFFTLYKGVLRLTSGVAVSDATITVVPPGISTNTSTSGRFSLRTRSDERNVTINVQIGRTNGKVRLKSLPINRNVVVDLELVAVIDIVPDDLPNAVGNKFEVRLDSVQVRTSGS